MDASAVGSSGNPHRKPPPTAAPAVIRKLDENVVNKIAAGEVIQRPASALKEMLENSLDAGSTQISIIVKEGGNKLLQITDNGCGIRKEDLPILCYRHTTSKLREYEDLETISTLGFRGEALCSISFVSHMTVTTMARGAQYGYRVTFKDSEMEAPGPRPVAAVPGTTITVEDLFYNVPTRRKALKSGNEEYGLILDVVGRYAVYSTGVAFSCRRQGDSRPDIATTAAGSRVDAVRAVYGADVAKDLLPLKLTVGGSTGPEVPVEGPMGLRVEGLISGANYGTGKKTVLVLFINGRCVECNPLRRALEGLYGTLLPKASRPWMFLDVRLPPRQVEVNMHPTKREVGFMHQAEVIEEIRRAVEEKLLASNESRTFATLQTQLPFASLPITQKQAQLESDGGRGGTGDAKGEGASGEPHREDDKEEGAEEEDAEGDEDVEGTSKGRRRRSRPAGGSAQDLKRAPSGAPAPLPYRPEKLIRVDFRAGTLDTFVIAKGKDRNSKDGSAGGNGDTASAEAARAAAMGGNVTRRRSAAARLQGSGPLDGADLGVRQHQERAAKPMPAGLLTAEVLGIGTYAAQGVSDIGEDEGAAGPRDAEGVLAARLPARRALPPMATSDPAVLELWAEVEAGTHAGLGDLLREHTFVGVADGTLALLQHGTRLYLVDVGALSRDMFYQLALRRWEQPLRLALEPAPLVSELVILGLQVLKVKGEWQPEDGSPEELGDLVTELLQQNGATLEKELGLIVDEQGRLRSVPLLLEGLLPDPARLPDLVVALAKDVDWEQPKERVRAIAAALADMYAARPPLLPEGEAGVAVGCRRTGGLEAASTGNGGTGSPHEGGQLHEDAERAFTEYEYKIKHVILSAMRGCLKPPRGRATDGSCVQVAALERLYRIFERC